MQKRKKGIYPKTECTKLKKTTTSKSPINLIVIIYISQAKQTLHHKSLLVSYHFAICSLEIPHFHCRLYNEESFTAHYQLKRHANQTHFNQKNCVVYNHLSVFHAKKRSHTVTSPARMINHYHFPFCSITIKKSLTFWAT